MNTSTPSQVAKALNLSVGTVRNWSREYAEYLTPAARGEHGHRRFSPDDVGLLRRVADLRGSGMNRDEILQRLADGLWPAAGDDVAPAVVDVTPEAPQTPQEAPHGAEFPPAVLFTLQRQIEALEARDRERFAVFVYGAAAGFIAFAIIFWLVWLLASIAGV